MSDLAQVERPQDPVSGRSHHRRLAPFVLAATAVATFGTAPARSTPEAADRAIDAAERPAVVDEILARIEGNHVFPAAAPKRARAARAHRSEGDHETIVSSRAFADRLIEPREVSKDRHLEPRVSSESLLSRMSPQPQIPPLRACAAHLSTIPPLASEADALDDYIRKEMKHRRIPGLAVAIVRGGAEASTRCYGQSDLESGSAVTAQTVFPVGSLTKPFTAIAVLLLVEDGRLALGDKLSAHLVDLPAAWQQVTVQHLLTHTSGIKDYTSLNGFDRMRRLDHLPPEILVLVQNEPLEFAPGVRFDYSNTNYLLLGMLIEHVAREPYGQFLDERVFAPLGMTQTRTNDSSDIVAGRARGYTRIPGRTQNAKYFSPTNAFAAGNVASSLADLVKWDLGLSSRKLLKPESYHVLWTPSDASKTGSERYGLGWGIGEINGHALFKHGGNITGFSSAILHLADDSLTIVVLSNMGDFNAEKLAQGIIGQVDPSAADKTPSTISDPEPKITERLQRVFLGMMSGEMSAGDFSERINRELGPLVRQGRQEARMQAAENGALESFTLLEWKRSDQGTDLVYRADFEYRMRVKVFISLDRSGRITNWGVRSAD